jgi:RNA polymerase sigma-70 factor (ECF subfamily)
METDEALYARVRKGDMRAFDALYECYAPRLYGFLAAMLRSRADAEDVFHEAFLSALEANDVDLRAGGFRAWLYRIARNRALNVLRSKRRGEQALGRIEEQELPPSADERIAAQEIGAALDGAVGRLPPLLSEVFHLRASGLSYEEMAQVLEIPLGTIKSRMSQMVAVLREEMKPWTAG